jgi:hypothetical protein
MTQRKEEEMRGRPINYPKQLNTRLDAQTFDWIEKQSELQDLTPAQLVRKWIAERRNLQGELSDGGEAA